MSDEDFPDLSDEVRDIPEVREHPEAIADAVRYMASNALRKEVVAMLKKKHAFSEAIAVEVVDRLRRPVFLHQSTKERRTSRNLYRTYILFGLGMLALAFLIPWIITRALDGELMLKPRYFLPWAVLVENGLRLWLTRR